jgi:hypothetical protein
LSKSWRRPRRLVFAILVGFVCAAVAGSAGAASADGGHLPGFSFMDKRVAIKKLPIGLRVSFQTLRGLEGFPGPHPPAHGPVWFGEVERPNATILVAGTRSWVCESEEPKEPLVRGGGGGCVALKYARQLDDISIGFCGKSRKFRIAGLAPDGVTELAIERSDGTISRTVPVLENTFGFTIGHVDITLRGVGDAAAEGVERSLPLVGAGGGGSPDGCSGLIFAEAKKPAK